MAQQGKCLQSHWARIPRVHGKAGLVTCVCNPPAPVWRCRQRQENPWKLAGRQAWHMHWLTAKEPTSKKEQGEAQHPKTSSVYTPTHVAQSCINLIYKTTI